MKVVHHWRDRSSVSILLNLQLAFHPRCFSYKVDMRSYSTIAQKYFRSLHAQDTSLTILVVETQFPPHCNKSLS